MTPLKPLLIKNDRRAAVVILSASFFTFMLVTAAGRVKLNLDPGFDVHYFSLLNAVVNSLVSVLLITGFIAVKRKYYVLHRNSMLAAIVLSAVFLLSYVCYHFLTESASYGGTGTLKYIYYVILVTHIFLAVVILPVVLFTAYRALTGDYEKHKKLTRITFPVWLYVSVTGVVVYVMISPYYN